MNEIEHVHSATGSASLKLVLGNAAGQRWNTTLNAGAGGWEAFTVASVANYAIAMAESPAGSYRYFASVPAGINTRGDIHVWLYDKAGALAAADLPNPIATGLLRWSGTAVVQESDAAAASELAKVPKQGQTFRHRNTVNNKSATVTIEAAP